MNKGQDMEPKTQWLLIGSEGHGKTLWVGDTAAVYYPVESVGLNLLHYSGHTYIWRNKPFRVGLCNPTKAELEQIPDLIESLRLTPIGWASVHDFEPGLNSTPQTVLFKDLPIGARFKYVNGTDVWVVLERFGLGKIAQWKGNILQFSAQSICSAGETQTEVDSLQVVLLPDTN